MTGQVVDATRDRVRLFRRIVVAVIVVSFGLAALGGIVVLLGGSLGSESWSVLGTTATVGAFSIAVLCCASLAGRRLRIFGLIGAIVSVLSAALVVWMLWFRGPYTDAIVVIADVMWSGVALSIAFAVSSLLLLLADRDQAAVRIGLVVTLVMFTAVLGMTLYAIWWSDTIRGEAFGRTLGVFGILAALGAVIVPVLSLLLRTPRARGGLSATALSDLEAEAARRGVTPDDLVELLLRPEPPTAAAPPVASKAAPPGPVDPR